MIRRFLMPAIALMAVLSTYFAADAAHADTVAHQCQGVDMLAEMQTASPERFDKVMADAQKVTNSEAVLWKIEKQGVAPSYLFGTMHLTDPRITVLPEKAKTAIAGSKTVVLEVADVSQEAMTAAMTKSGALLLYTDGTTLASKLSPDEYKQVQAVVAKSGMPAEFAALMRPWIVSLFLAMSDCERKQVTAGAPVLDGKVSEEAKAHNVKVIGFETVEQQLQALASVPEDQQVAMLKVGLKYVQRSDDMMETLVQMYLKRKIAAAMPFQIALAAEKGTPASAFEGFKKSLLADRNLRMRDGALPILSEGNAFIAVGALHLGGSDGLVALLREAGYTVTAVE
jgi:uncharacterized protein YbaP (TraB family)